MVEDGPVDCHVFSLYCIHVILLHLFLCLSAVKMAELLAIKRELTVIKVQIDGLLDCVDKMDKQRKDCSGRDSEWLEDALNSNVGSTAYTESVWTGWMYTV